MISIPLELYCPLQDISNKVRIRLKSGVKPTMNKVIETAIELATSYNMEQTLYPFTDDIPEGVQIGEMYPDYDETR